MLIGACEGGLYKLHFTSQKNQGGQYSHPCHYISIVKKKIIANGFL